MSRKGNNKGQPSNQSAQNRDTPPAQAQNRSAPGHESLIDPTSSNSNGNRVSDHNSDGQIFQSDDIAARAYQIFEHEGRMDGHAMDHWLQAERELKGERAQPPRMTPQNAPRSERQHQQSGS
ncbi:MAG: DUF2934 domain-containing protein [Limisphaerales bacterium]